MKRLFLVLAVAWACALPVSGSTFVAMSDEELVRGSAAVVEGEVLRNGLLLGREQLCDRHGGDDSGA